MKHKSLNILVVEDEFITANAIQDALISFGHKVAGIARDAIDAIEILDNHKIDIAILDINIQGSKNGIWLGNKIANDYNLPFIFLTAYGDEATIESAVKTKPAGYLTKPFKKADIHSTISLAMQNKDQQVEHKPSALEENELAESVFVKGRNGFLKIILKDILYIQSEQKYIKLYTVDQEHSLRYSLQEIFQKLPKNIFFKVHRSYIVNKNNIDGIGPCYLDINDERIPISANKKDEILSQLEFL